MRSLREATGETVALNTFGEIALILALAVALGGVGLLLRQPLIIAFLAVGIVAGPSVAGLIRSYDQIELLSHVGIALLLFIVGLKLDVQVVRTLGPVALATGIGQIVFTSLIGFAIAGGMGMETRPAAYVSVALTFSSTIIIVKLLSDKKEIDSLHGRIAVGFLLVQDIVAILALVALTTLGGAGEGTPFTGVTAARLALGGAGMLGLAAAMMKLARTRLADRLARSPELLVLSSIAWAVAMGAGSEALGFTREVGAFVAGVSLASCPYRDAMAGRLATVRDFLLLFFFIDLGARLDWSAVGSQLMPAVVFSAFVLIGNPLIVLAIMGAMGYRRRTGFLAGLTVAQISEFSLILGAVGVSLGHLSSATMGLITLVGVVTIFASTYMILYSAALYRLLSRPLRIFERRVPYRELLESNSQSSGADLIVLGLGSYGSRLVEQLQARGKRVMGVDFDPQALESWRARGLPVLYGDGADPELYERLPLSGARWFVSTVRSVPVNRAVVSLLRQCGYAGSLALTAATPEEAEIYRRCGAHRVLCPFQDAAEEAADVLSRAPTLLAPLPDWPLTFEEVRLRSGSPVVGQRLRDVPFGSLTGASLVAVLRGGRVHYSPDPDFRLLPGDHVILAGCPDNILRVREFLSQTGEGAEDPAADAFVMKEMVVPEESDLVGRTLAEVRFRQRYQASVIGIRRGRECLVAPGPQEWLRPGDRLLLIGPALPDESTQALPSPGQPSPRREESAPRSEA